MNNAPCIECLPFKVMGFRDLGGTCTDNLLWDNHSVLWDQKERRGGDNRRAVKLSISPTEASLTTDRAVRQTHQAEFSQWDLVSIHSICTLFYNKRSPVSSSNLLRYHDNADQRLTLPQAFLSEDTRQSGQPSATETTHAPCQRVQKPHTTGCYQRLWNWERRQVEFFFFPF